MAKRPPSKSIHWSSIPKDATIEIIGKKGSQSYVAVIKGRRYWVYWTGEVSTRAQLDLNRRARKLAHGDAVVTHRSQLPTKYKGMFRSKASGQRAYVTGIVPTTMSGKKKPTLTVFLRLEPQGTNGYMPLSSFERQYVKESKRSADRRRRVARNSRGRFTRA